MTERKVITRKFEQRGLNLMHNKYYQVNETINVDNWIEDCFVDPLIAQEIIEEGWLEEYNSDGSFPMYVCIVEAYGKTWVFLNQYGDGISTVAVDMDGEVRGSSFGNPSLDLDGKCYYAGDEVTIMGFMDKFESVNQWVWKGFETNCKNKMFTISNETMKRFIEKRGEYLKEQAGKA